MLAAHYLGAVKPPRIAAEIDTVKAEEQDFIPAQVLTETEFDSLLEAMRLPTGKPESTP